VRKEISEKTLELNVCAELLPLIRSIPGCSRTFWFGMKQDQEARNGIDELIANVPRAMHIMLQFKSPNAKPRGGNRLVYSLNERQHDNLLRTAQPRPQGVFYVLPHLNTMMGLKAAAPSLLKQTWALPVASLGPLSGSPSGRHRVESAPPNCTVFSEAHEASLLPIAAVLATSIAAAQDKSAASRGPLTGEEVRELVDRIEESAAGNRNRLGQSLRGLADIVLP